MNDSFFDPRAIANLILDTAEERKLNLTNLSLQKLVYFAHGISLTRYKKPLVSGYFEAWQFGPVHPLIYKEFKDCGKYPINKRATSQDLLTGETTVVKIKPTKLLTIIIDSLFDGFAQLPASRLVDISHARGGPWYQAVDKDRTNIAFNPRISDKLIEQYFRFHLVSIDDLLQEEIDLEDTPIT